MRNICPVCGGKFPRVNAKTNEDKSVKVWRRVCPVCGALVVDTAIFSRVLEAPENHRPQRRRGRPLKAERQQSF